jgi:hypothetical protein
MDNPTLPPPLIGCLVCHVEGELTLSESRRFPGVASHPIVTCDHCGSVALLDYDENKPDDWRIRYRKIPTDYPYAAWRLGRAGWLDADAALDLSTEVFVQRQRLQQTLGGDLAWLKPSRLTPPPPLMTADETVYLSLKPVSYCETSARRLPLLGNSDIILDSGTLYVTDSKIHLLGQRRDRSQRLSEVRHVDYEGDVWRLHVAPPHYYKGFGQVGALDAELVTAIVQALIHNN